MHYTGTVWRPPYEASSLLLEVTAGCTHHKCKFCTLYDDIPFKFRMTPLEDIESDLKETKGKFRLWTPHNVTRTFLVGANPFVLKASRLLEIAALIQQYYPSNDTIGCFSRITDITLKTDYELLELKRAGYDGLTIGIETGDDEALTFMNKGYLSKDILIQCKRLDSVGISYSFFYLTGISGMRNGKKGAAATAEICNQLHPHIVGASMLTIYPNSELFQEIQKGNWQEEAEIEKYQAGKFVPVGEKERLEELQVFINNLQIRTHLFANSVSNFYPTTALLPKERDKIINELQYVIDSVNEEEMQEYRKNLNSLG